MITDTIDSFRVIGYSLINNSASLRNFNPSVVSSLSMHFFSTVVSVYTFFVSMVINKTFQLQDLLKTLFVVIIIAGRPISASISRDIAFTSRR